MKSKKKDNALILDYVKFHLANRTASTTPEWIVAMLNNIKL